MIIESFQAANETLFHAHWTFPLVIDIIFTISCIKTVFFFVAMVILKHFKLKYVFLVHELMFATKN